MKYLNSCEIALKTCWWLKTFNIQTVISGWNQILFSAIYANEPKFVLQSFHSKKPQTKLNFSRFFSLLSYAEVFIWQSRFRFGLKRLGKLLREKFNETWNDETIKKTRAKTWKFWVEFALKKVFHRYFFRRENSKVNRKNDIKFTNCFEVMRFFRFVKKICLVPARTTSTDFSSDKTNYKNLKFFWWNLMIYFTTK